MFLRVRTKPRCFLFAVCVVACAPGDKRSFVMLSVAAHRLAGEKRKGWAVVNVVAEMCEALVGTPHVVVFVCCSCKT